MATASRRPLHPSGWSAQNCDPRDEPETFILTPLFNVARSFPAMILASVVAVVIARYGYHLTDGSLTVGAAVPLIALFVVSRVFVALTPFRSHRRFPVRIVSRRDFVTMGLFVICVSATLTFFLSGAMFSFLKLGDAATNAFNAMYVSGILAAISLGISLGVALHEHVLSRLKIKDLTKPLIAALTVALVHAVLFFLSIPTMLSMPELWKAKTTHTT